VLATDIAEEKFAPLADALIATRRLDVTEDHEIAALAGAQFQGASLIDTQLQGASSRAALLPALWTRSSAAPCDRSRPMPCAGSSRCAGAPPRGCHLIKVRLCGTGYQLSKPSKMFA
jgi:hypothetical protein